MPIYDAENIGKAPTFKSLIFLIKIKIIKEINYFVDSWQVGMLGTFCYGISFQIRYLISLIWEAFKNYHSQKQKRQLAQN